MGRAGPYAGTPLGDVEAACAGLSPEDRDRLVRAARLLRSQRGLLPRVAGWLGGQAERMAGLLGPRWREQVETLVAEALTRAQDVAHLGLDPGARRPAPAWRGRMVTMASGAATGLAGLPGALVDIPLTTVVILRSIAEIAREEGEDVGSEAGRRACLEVLALGAPTTSQTAPVAGEEAEVGYWTARLGLAAMNVGALVPQAARLLGGALSEKILAQAVPLAGAVAGAGLNYAFISYYQSMARAHFAVRAVERAHPDDPAVAACLRALVNND